MRGEGEIADAITRRIAGSALLASCRGEGLERDPVGLVFDTTGRGPAGVTEATTRILVGWAADGAAPPALAALNLEECVDHAGDLAVAPGPAQIAAPILSALMPSLRPCYAEVTTTLASASVPRGLRLQLDGFLAAIERALELAGAPRAKAIVVVSPADPPVAMRVALAAVARRGADLDQARSAAATAVEDVRRRWPRCRPRGGLTVRERRTPWGKRPVASLDLALEAESGMPSHAGNADAMAAAALTVGEEIVRRRQG